MLSYKPIDLAHLKSFFKSMDMNFENKVNLTIDLVVIQIEKKQKALGLGLFENFKLNTIFF